MPELFDVGGRHVLVTGASSGLGRHFAGFLAGAGAKVTAAARRKEALQQVVDAARAEGGQAQSVVMDITDAASIERGLDGAEAEFGPVTVLVNNAGIAVTAAALDLDARGWDDVVGTNLRGAWLTAQAAAKRMVAHKTAGSIINIASILGLRVAGGVSAYAISKAGVIQMTKALALEWARYGIRINAMAPGYIETELNSAFFASDLGKSLIRRIPQRRLGQARELEGALLLLASDAGSYMTGSVIAIDGGHLVSGL